ncbi:MAG: proton-conducting transporter membrane subunit [Acholeplasmataceae bacterium]|nr:proton-conducting transporter membrane subunit [Acholeplasmataceae bacterium]
MHLAPVLFVFIPILASLVVYLFKSKLASYVLFAAQIALFIVYILYIQALAISPELSLIVFGGWDEQFAISFFNDRLSLIFVGLTIFMWTILLMYTFKTNQRENKFLFFLMFLQGIFLGLLQTNDLFNLFVFLELMTVLITILIAYKKTGPSFRAGIYYLLLNTVGAMFFLIGIILIYYVYGTINIQYLVQNINLHSDENLIKLAFVMMMSGISIKAAFFPLFTWLPKAHGVAQTSISALLSGLVVKGALYMFIRIYIEMFSKANYNMAEFFFYLGATTAIVGVTFALTQKDLKQVLAYHTVSQIGIMVMGLSSASDLSFTGGLMHILNHALFKSLLFLGAGLVIYGYQTKKIYEIRGVFKSMPWTAILLIIGMLSISGAPLFNGFVSKTLVKYDFKGDLFKMALFTLINIGTITSFIKFSQILYGPKVAIVKRKDITQLLSMSILGILCIAIGIFYVPIGFLVFGRDLSYVKILDVRQWIDYITYVMIGMVFYRYIVKRDFKPLQMIREWTVTFENANYVFILYMVFLSFFMFFR